MQSAVALIAALFVSGPVHAGSLVDFDKGVNASEVLETARVSARLDARMPSGRIVGARRVEASGGKCAVDRAFLQLGWKLHPSSEFDAVLAKVKRRVESGEGIKKGVSFPLYSEELHKLIELSAYDDTNTNSDTMIDDYVFIANDETKKVIEVRWFEGGKQHLVYRDLSCANKPIPWAYNSMW
jgi:hypothetical protein